MGLSARVYACIFAAAGAIAGCGGGIRDDAASGRDAGPGPGVFSGGPIPDGGAPSFAVTPTGPVTVCPGECAFIGASASGGVPPYELAWDHALPGGSVPLHVCPDETTTYTVVASDSSGTSGEFASPAATATASVTVTIAPDCDAGAAIPDAAAPDAGPADAAPSEASVPPEVPIHGAEICRLEWPQPRWLGASPSQMATDAQGNSYVLVDHYNQNSDGPPTYLQLGATQAPDAYGMAVLKIDDDCHLVWMRDFGGASSSANVTSVALAVDAQSNVTIVGWFGGTVDLGAGPVSPLNPSGTETFVLRLDAGGKVVFSKVFTTRQIDAAWPYGVAVTPDGSSYIALAAANDTDFGGGVDLGDVLSGHAMLDYLVRLDASGNLVFRKTTTQVSSPVEEILEVASDGAGNLWGTAVLQNQQQVLIGISPDGAATWTQDSGPIASIVARTSGLVSLASPENLATLKAYAPDGTSPWTSMLPESSYGSDLLAADAVGLLASGGQVWGPYAANAPTAAEVSPLPSAGGLDIGFQAFDARGQVVSQGSWGGPEDDYFSGVGVDPAGDIFLAGYTEPVSQDYTPGDFVERVFFVKLAR